MNEQHVQVELKIDHRKYLRKVATSSVLNSLISGLATALFLPLVVRKAGMEAYGVWAMLSVFIGITSLLDFGVWKSLVYFIARGEHRASQLLSSSLAACLSGAAIFTVGLFLLLVIGVPIFGPVIEAAPGLKWWMAGCGCILLVTGLMTNLARGMLEAAYRGHLVNIGFAMLTLLQYSMAFLLVQFTVDPRALLAGSAAVFSIVLIVHVLWLWSVFDLRWIRPSIAALKSIWRYAAGSFLAELPITLLAPMLSYLFVLNTSSASAYGSFDLALRITTLAATALGMLSSPFFAMVANARDEARTQVRRVLNRYLRLTLGLALLGWLAFLMFGKLIIVVLFPDGSLSIYRAVLIMLGGNALVAALEPVARMLMGVRRLSALAFARALTLLTALLVIVLLQNQMPLDRFAIAYGAGYLALAAGLLWLNQHEKWGKEPRQG